MGLEGINSQGRGQKTTSGRPKKGWGQLDMLLMAGAGERREFLWYFTNAKHPPLLVPFKVTSLFIKGWGNFFIYFMLF